MILVWLPGMLILLYEPVSMPSKDLLRGAIVSL